MIHRLRRGPPFGELAERRRFGAAQQQEIVRRAEPRMREQTKHALLDALLEARLQDPDFLDAAGETTRNRHALRLFVHDACRGGCPGDDRFGAVRDQFFGARAHRLPQQRGEQERGRDGLVRAHAFVRARERAFEQNAEAIRVHGFQRARGRRKHLLEQTVRLQRVKAGKAIARKEKLQRLVEQPRRRRIGKQRPEPRERRRGFRRDGEIEFRSETRRAQHAHRIFAIARVRIADQAQCVLLEIVYAADIVAHAEIGDVVIERVHGEVAAQRVFLDRAVDVVAHDAPVDEMTIAAAVVAGAAKRRDFDDLAAEHDVRKSKAAADQTAVAEQAAHLLGRRVGRDVEILRVAAEQEIAHCAADQKRLITGLVQPVQHAQRAVGDVAP